MSKRTNTIQSQKKLINDIFIKNHRIFNENEVNAQIIIVIIYYTLTKRHKSNALIENRKKKTDRSKKQIDTQINSISIEIKICSNYLNE